MIQVWFQVRLRNMIADLSALSSLIGLGSVALQHAAAIVKA
jgi:hypothetical protein